MLIFTIFSVLVLQVLAIPSQNHGLTQYTRLMRLMKTLSLHDSTLVGNSIKSKYLVPQALARNVLNPLTHHDARKDDQSAIALWLRMDKSPVKKFILHKLLKNPTVEFTIQQKIKAVNMVQVPQRYFDPQRLGNLDPVIDQAAELGDIDAVIKLNSKGLRVTANTVNAAARSGNLELLQMLLHYTKIRPDDFTVLSSILGEQLDVVKYLVEKYSIKIDALVLNFVAVKGSLEIAQYLMSRVTSVVDLKMFVLRPAAREGRMDIVRYILDTKSSILKSPNYVVKADEQLLEDACLSGSVDLIKYLINRHGIKPNGHCLINAASSGIYESVAYLIDVCKIEPDSDTITAAIGRFNIKLIKYLLDNFLDKFDMNQNILFNSLLSKSAEIGDVEFFTYLYGKLNANLPSDILEISCKFGQIEMVKFLIDTFHLEPDEYCLHEAAWSGNIDLFNYLFHFHEIKPNSLTLNYACRGADADLKNDHSQMILFVKAILDISAQK